MLHQISEEQGALLKWWSRSERNRWRLKNETIWSNTHSLNTEPFESMLPLNLDIYFCRFSSVVMTSTVHDRFQSNINVASNTFHFPLHHLHLLIDDCQSVFIHFVKQLRERIDVNYWEYMYTIPSTLNVILFQIRDSVTVSRLKILDFSRFNHLILIGILTISNIFVFLCQRMKKTLFSSFNFNIIFFCSIWHLWDDIWSV